MTLTRNAQSGPAVRSLFDRWLGEMFMAPRFEAPLADTAPALNVLETGDAYVVEVALPGMEPEAIDVTVEGRTLTIKGTYDDRQRDQTADLLREWGSGTFLRSVALPAIVDAESARSDLRNGALILTLPKAAQHRARRLQIGSDARNSQQNQGIDGGNGRNAKRVSGGATSEASPRI
jgi:HSP20 family protein